MRLASRERGQTIRASDKAIAIIKNGLIAAQKCVESLLCQCQCKVKNSLNKAV